MAGSSPDEAQSDREGPAEVASTGSVHQELWELSRALRAHLEWQRLSGSRGLPRDPNPVPALPPGGFPEARAEARAAPPRAEVEKRFDVAAHSESEVRGADAAIGSVPANAVPANAAAKRFVAESAPAERSQAVSEPGPQARSEPRANPSNEPPRVVVAAPPPPASAAALSARSEQEVRQRLQVLCEEARQCTRCGLHATRKQAVFARGTGVSGLCFVGEGPGADEDAQGFPFVGAAGQLLDRMINAMGLPRDDVYICNIVKCRPPNNRKPEAEEMAACAPYLREQLELLAPKVIVALGATAVQGLLGTTEGITRLRGKWKLYKGEVPVMPTFHPAYLLRTPSAKREVWDDLQAVVRQMGRSLPDRPVRE